MHAGAGSSWQLNPPLEYWVERNTLLLVAKAFPLRWSHLILYRQLGWARQALRERRLGAQLRGAMAALALWRLMDMQRLLQPARIEVH